MKNNRVSIKEVKDPGYYFEPGKDDSKYVVMPMRL